MKRPAGPLVVTRRDMWDGLARRFGPYAVGEFGLSWDRLVWQGTVYGRALWHEVVRRHGSPPGRVLELGCGWGRLFPVFRDVVGARATYVGVDWTRGLLREGASRFGPFGARFVHACGTELPVAAQAMDAVVTCTVLQHCDDALASRSISELLRVLHPGGTLVLLENVHAERGSDAFVFRRQPQAYVDRVAALSKGRLRLRARAVVECFGERHMLFSGRFRD